MIKFELRAENIPIEVINLMTGMNLSRERPHCPGCGRFCRASATSTDWDGEYSWWTYCSKCGRLLNG